MAPHSTMLEISAYLLGGLGLFFIGVDFVTGHLKQITGRRFRWLVSRVTQSGILAGAWGVVSGVMMQSATAVTFIVASLASAGMIQVRKALPILAWSNVGSSVLVLLAVLDLRLAALYLLGAVGLCHYFGLERSTRYRHLLGALLGVGMLFLGLQLLKAGAEPLKEIEWFTRFLDYTRKSYALAFFVGAFLTFIAQSTSTVAIIAMTLAKVGLLGFDQTTMVIYGTNFGSSLNLWFMGGNLRGVARQAILFQVIFKWLGIALFVPLFYLELYAHLPLVKALVGQLAGDLSHQMALVYLAFQVITSLLVSLFLTPLNRWLQRLSPVTREEELSRPQFIYDQAVEDVETALDLVEQEQHRLVKRLPDLLDTVRADRPSAAPIDPATLHAASAALAREISAFTTDVAGRNESRESIGRVLALTNRNELLASLDETVHELVQAIARHDPSKALRPLLQRLAEGLHTVLVTLVDAVESPDAVHREMLGLITGDRGPLMERIRRNFLRREGELGYEEQQAFFTATSLFEQSIWLSRRLASTLADSETAKS